MNKFALIGDAETLIGFKIGGISVDDNIYIYIGNDTSVDEINKKYNEIIKNEDVKIIFICDYVATKIEEELNKHINLIPTVMIIPSSKNKLHN